MASRMLACCVQVFMCIVYNISQFSVGRIEMQNDVWGAEENFIRRGNKCLRRDWCSLFYCVITAWETLCVRWKTEVSQSDDPKAWKLFLLCRVTGWKMFCSSRGRQTSYWFHWWTCSSAPPRSCDCQVCSINHVFSELFKIKALICLETKHCQYIET